MASFITNTGADGLLSGSIDWAANTIKARLVLASVTPDKDDDVMTGKTGIGTDQTLGSKTKVKSDTTDRVTYDAADPVFPTVTIGSTFGWLVIYKFVTNDADSIPIAVLDLPDTATNGLDVTIGLNAAGAFYLQQ
ncbi:MAG: hypothetical protein ABI665_03795 [Vicinamibacterales bacterium]